MASEGFSMSDRAALLSRARRLHEQSRWLDACDAFAEADRLAPLAVEDLELFAESAQILGRRDDAVSALERSYRARVEAGQIEDALRSAYWLWQAWALSSEFARASGWMVRARQLTEERDGATEHGWLLVTDAYSHITAAPEVAVELLVRAARLGTRGADPDLVAFATTMCGRAMIKAGRLKEGLSQLDEAMLQVTDGELSPRARSMLYCSAIATCHETGELARAQEWTLALGSWLESLPQLGGVYFGNCRIYRSQLMRLTGAWAQAIHELEVACEDLSHGSGRLIVGHAFYELGEMHRLRGDPGVAEAAYRRAGEYGGRTQPGLALLRLQQDEITTATSAIRRALAETEAPLDRFQLLPAFVRIMLAAGDLNAARDAVAELRRVADVYDTAAVRAEAAHAEGTLTLAEGRPESALPILRRAAQAWRRLEAPYETAQVLIAIATACRALSDEEAALLELESAHSVFAGLGARPDLERVQVLIEPSPTAHTHGLTARELEILRLIASGKTNHAIAAELYLSERTVHRHVSNIFRKLGVYSRTAAAAYAIEHHLIQPRIL